ncbi:MAG: cupin domain-containing protein [Bacteroidales bacterium]|nr:cupin domain-containing protein [Bacteroidales bacterium]
MMKVWTPTEREIENTKAWGNWSKEVSEFPWFYDDQETCFILEGEAEVSDEKGNIIRFKAGDMVQFEEGLECVWKITRAVKKRYIFGEG